MYDRAVCTTGQGKKLPPKGPERDELGFKAVELADNGISYHNISLQLDIPFGSISRLIKKYRTLKSGRN